MAEIWDLFDQFTCKICFKQFTSVIFPIIICQNAHLICRQCLININKSSNLSKLLCPFCRAIIQPYHAIQHQKLLQLKEIVIQIMQKQKKEGKILRKIKEEIGFSNQLSLSVQKLYSELTVLDRKWEYVQNLHRNCTVQNAILWKKTFEFQNQVRKIREQLSNISEVNKKLTKEGEQNVLLKRKNILLTKQIKYLIEKIASLSNSSEEKPAQQCDLNKRQRLPQLYKCIIDQNIQNYKLSNQSCELKQTFLEESFLVTMYKNKSQVFKRQQREVETHENKCEALRYRAKSHYPPRIPKKQSKQ